MIKVILAIMLTAFLSTSVVSCSFFKKSKKVDAEKIEDQSKELSEFGDDEEGEDPLGVDGEGDDDLASNEEDDGFADDDDFLGDDESGEFDQADADGSVDDEDFFDDEEGEGGSDLADTDTDADSADEDPLDSDSDESFLADTDTDDGGVVTSGETDYSESTASLTNDEPIQEIPENPNESSESFSSESLNTDIGSEGEPVELGSNGADQFSGGIAKEKSWVPVQKMKTEPFTRRGVLANALYVARAGDTLKSISRKIYGKNRVRDLLKVNSTLSRGLKVGDKVYYNSPQRPNDNSTMLTYYDDIGASPQVYVTQPGDNIRKLSKSFLGSSGSWKEVYATNPFVDSKGALEGGIEIKYWSGDGGGSYTPPPTEVAEYEPPAEENFPEPEPVVQKAPPAQKAVVRKQTPPPAQARNEPVQVAKNDEIPLPPPAAAPVKKKIPPAPPKINVAKKKLTKKLGSALKKKKRKINKKLASARKKQEQDSVMMLGAAGIGVIALLALFIIWRKKRSRNEIDFNTAATHIE